KPELWSRPAPIIAANQAAIQPLQHGLAMAQSTACLQEDLFSRPINRHFFGNACSVNWWPSIQPTRRPPGYVRTFPPRTCLQRGTPELSKSNFKRDSRPLAMARALASHPMLSPSET